MDYINHLDTDCTLDIPCAPSQEIVEADLHRDVVF